MISRLIALACVVMTTVAEYLPGTGVQPAPDLRDWPTRPLLHRVFQNARRADVGRLPRRDQPGGRLARLPARLVRLAVGRSTMERDWTEVQPRPLAPPLQDRVRSRSDASREFRPAPRRHRPASPAGCATLCRHRERPVVRAATGSSRTRLPNSGGRTEARQMATSSTSATHRSTSPCRPRSSRVAPTRSRSSAWTASVSTTTTCRWTTSTSAPPAAITDASVESTVLYKRRADGLVELATARVRTTRPLGTDDTEAYRRFRPSSRSPRHRRRWASSRSSFEVPARRTSRPLTLHVDGIDKAVYQGHFHAEAQVDGLRAADGAGRFRIQRSSGPHAGVGEPLHRQGAGDPARHPSYSFTLDAAANLESYLATRKRAKARNFSAICDRQMGHERAVRELLHRAVDPGRAVPRSSSRCEPARRHGFRSILLRRPTSLP